MKILINTSTPECLLILVKGNEKYEYKWEAGRSLADGILKFIADCLAKHDTAWEDISGVGVMQGPGSFTGLRIGITTANTMADALDAPIVGGSGEKWIEQVIERLENGQNDKVVMPEYGRDANITTPRK